MYVTAMTFSKITNIVLLVVAMGFLGGTLYFRADASQARQNAASAFETARQYQALADARLASLESIRGLWMDERTALHNRALAAEAVAKQYKEQSDALSRALGDNPDWASGAIPDGVRSAIKRASDRP